MVALALSRAPSWVGGTAVVLAVTGAAMAMARRWSGRRWVGALALCTLAVALGLLATWAQMTVRTAGLVPDLARQRAIALVDVVITSDPRVISSTDVRRTELVLVHASVRTVVGRGQVSESSTPVLVFGDAAWTRVRWHERVRTSGRFGASEPSDDVVAVFEPSGTPAVVSRPGPVARAAEHVRAGLRDAVSGLPEDARGLLPGLVIGDTSRTPQSLTDAMRDTGMTHLSAVSGSNVAVVLSAAMMLCRAVGLRRRWRPLLAALCLAGFVVLARPEPSVLRAAVMGCVGLLAFSASRRQAGIPALSAAIIVLLCIDPWLARSYGFALSSLATLGLLLFARPWGRWFARFLPRRLAPLGDAIAIPVAAQAMCAPVIVLLQGSVTVIGVLANLLSAPLVAPATVVGVSVALVAVVAAAVARLLAWVAAVPTLGIAWIARACAGVPMGSLPWPDGAGGALLLAGISLLLLFSGPWLVALTRRWPYAVACLGVLVLAATWPTRSHGWPPPGWRFVACDVGQGDGLVLATSPGHAVVVDTGPDPVLMNGCLQRLHVSVVDAVVLTHFHADHVQGLPGVLGGRTVRQILVTPVRDPPDQVRDVQRWAAAAGVPMAELYAGDSVRWDGVAADVLWPAREIHAGSVPNNASIVLAAHTGGLRLLLLGDVEPEAASQVLLALRRDPAYRRTDVLKVAHHGSAKQDPALLAYVDAPIAVISVGLGNDYGHPAPSALRLLRDDGYTVFRTDRVGDVAVLSEGDRPMVATRGP